jgi:hypothetical protein
MKTDVILHSSKCQPLNLQIYAIILTFSLIMPTNTHLTPRKNRSKKMKAYNANAKTYAIEEYKHVVEANTPPINANAYSTADNARTAVKSKGCETDSYLSTLRQTLSQYSRRNDEGLERGAACGSQRM